MTRGFSDPRGYVEVPAGRHAFGEKGETIEITAPFRIGRYPVTNGQYQAFVDEGGYAERRWWSADGWAWRQVQSITEPEYWRHRMWNAPNQPVVGVSFWEAEACAAWAGGRLPIEQEWEAAARGPGGFAYPWGSDWADDICNTYEADLGCTSAVGIFPRAGRAVLGINDLAGNVWEWCASLYRAGRSHRWKCCPCAARRVLERLSGRRARSPIATGPFRATGTTASAFVWCVRPIIWDH